jgi:hypothetical protein
MNPCEPSAENPPAVRPPESSPAARVFPRGWKIALVVVEPLSVAALFIFLLEQSWQRWSDPLVDFPRELYMAWRISVGDLLYQRVTNWYGPLPQLIEGAGFKIFGVGLDTMVWMNIALTVGVLLLLRGIFGMLGNRLMVWLASVVFLGVFAFEQYDMEASNFTFIAPYISQATYGFAGLLLVIWGLLRHLKVERPIWLVVAGLGAGIAYLDKPEPVLAAGGALGIYLLAQIIRRARSAVVSSQTDWRGAGRWAARAIGWLAVGFFTISLPVFIFFFAQDGFTYALRATNWVLLSVLDPTTRQIMATAPVMQTVIGFDHPWKNFIGQVEAGAGLVLVCGVIVVVARDWARQRVFSEGEWLGWRANEWRQIGRAFAFPVLLAAVVAAGWCLRSAWRPGAEFARMLGLAVLGVPAGLMLARIIFNTHIDSYGFFMMPLAILFWIHLVVVEAARGQPGRARGRWLLPALFSVLTLSGTALLLNFNLYVFAHKTYPVGEGRDRLYFFPPDINPQGLMLNAMITAVKEKIPTAQTLVVFPEGIAVNYHCRVPTSLAELEFNPVALGFARPQHVIDELNAHPPEAAMLFNENIHMFGVQYFGQNEASGSDIIRWLNDKYKVIARGGESVDSASGHKIDVMVPQDAPGPSGQPLLPDRK